MSGAEPVRGRGRGRVTLGDVAAASGVSRATAGFVLSGDPRQSVSEPTRERVRRAARELGYVPHGLARALREGSSRVVVLELGRAAEGNYSRSYIRGLDAELAAHGHVLLVRHGHTEPAASWQVLDAIAPKAVLRFGAVPQRQEPGEPDGWSDAFAAHVGLQIGRLAERGHAGFALALPAGEAPRGALHRDFAERAAQECGIALRAPVFMPRPREASVSVLADFLERTPGLTAVAAYDDEVALRVIAALRDLGLGVPGDVAVIGFDDADFGALVAPALTTVHIDAEGHGRRAARAALGLGAADLALGGGRVVVRESA